MKVDYYRVSTTVSSKGGKLLYFSNHGANSYLTIDCGGGHIWNTRFRSLNNGSWCKSCAGNTLLGIKAAFDIAKIKNGKCLSNYYKNNKTKLKWQCNICNHIWKTSLSNIKRGSWCPDCSIKIRSDKIAKNPDINYRKCNECKIVKGRKHFQERSGAKGKYIGGKCKQCTKPQIRKWQRKNNKKRWALEPNYALRITISNSINRALKLSGSNKSGKSCFGFFSYSVQDLKAYLESKFEFWMTWDNWGRYNKETWDDNKPFTWTWNIDHIIPQSKLPFSNMDCVNFEKCWSLDNLRPYSSKQNIIDGDRG